MGEQAPFDPISSFQGSAFREDGGAFVLREGRPTPRQGRAISAVHPVRWRSVRPNLGA